MNLEGSRGQIVIVLAKNGPRSNVLNYGTI